ncbi:hypothetical protein HPP92_018824 [Vanilla planifolia]|uniref:Uncharacterized protein n=1 Tax=Vanilla planifolia TaxID=51239 RepID=A0A835Q1U5_VANPL|nr:hypothetical protein HPP92_018824 [Vanilla planifolia]
MASSFGPLGSGRKRIRPYLVARHVASLLPACVKAARVDCWNVTTIEREFTVRLVSDGVM